MKTRRSGLTMVEILVVVGIIALLIGILIPATSMVRRMAREVKQKAQLTAIDLGLAAFKNDYGDYPPSDWWYSDDRSYCGAQKLAEAMVGWDLMGFHPNTDWQGSGLTLGTDPTLSYDPTHSRDVDSDGIPDTLTERRDRYVELDMANAFYLVDSVSGANDGLFPDPSGAYGNPLARGTYVLCDVFEVKQRKIKRQDGSTVSPGTPLLYFRANPARKFFPTAAEIAGDLSLADRSVYDARDNSPLVQMGFLADWNKAANARRIHPLKDFSVFYDEIRDPKVTRYAWPRRPDSYILISAGYDGLYGTDDDICNFPR